MSRLVLLVCVLLLAACAAPALPATLTPAPLPTADSPLQNVFAGSDAIPGWSASGDTRFYNPENLFDLVDGQADAFFAYNMRAVAVRRYENTQGGRLDAEVWQVATPEDAYGLFTAGLSGEPTAMGNEGDLESGRRISFWQASYVVHVGARQQVDDALLMSFAGAIAKQLPAGGERPALVARLPQAGLQPRGFLFFRKEISVQDQLWLGGKNILGLGPETGGVLGRYSLDGQAARLLLVEYPDAGKAAAGQAALRAGGVADLQVVDVKDNLLGAVFGKAAPDAASRLLADGLQK